MTATFGTPVVVDASGSDPIDIVSLSSTQSMAIYEDTARLKAVILTNGDPPTVNTELDIDPTSVFGDEAVLVALTSTTAMVVYEHNNAAIRARILSVSGTTITANAQTTLTDNKAAASSLAACFISSTRVLYAYNASSQGHAVVLSVSGTTITENTIITFGAAATTIGNTKCAIYSSTRAIVTYGRIGTALAFGIILTMSGVVLTANTEKQIHVAFIAIAKENSYAIAMSSTQVVYGDLSSSISTINNFVLTLNGITFDVGAVTTASQDANNSLSAAELSSTSLIVANEDTVTLMNSFKYNITGGGSDELTLDGSDTLDESPDSIDTVRCAPVDSSNIIVFYINTVGGSGVSAVQVNSAANQFTIAPMRKPCDIDADGSFLYIAVLDNSGFPALIKIATSLSADGSSVFAPGAGTDIGVQCGRFDSGIVYVAGDFGGTDVVEKSVDSGAIFTVIDPATFGTVETFIVGPDSDNRVLVSDVTNDDIQQTIDGGTVWTAINSAVGFDIVSMARLDRNVQEMVLGAKSAATLNINYTVNSGDDTEDIGTSPFPESDVNGVIVN